MKRVAITTLGCKTNQFESAAIRESLERSGFSIVPFEEAADVYVINSCTVTARTDAESRKLVRRAKRRNPEARIVVTGCYAQVAPEILAAMPEVELVIGNEEKKQLVELLSTTGPAAKVKVADISAIAETGSLGLESFAEHTRAFLQVQNGCDSFCSYCIVPYARGRSRSVPLEEVLDGIARLAGEGFREVVLTGIHLGNYGRDLSPKSSLLPLLRAAEQRGVPQRLRLGSLEPLDITPELIDCISSSAIICPHLHIPLQSGSDSVLSRMNRGYGADYFQDLCLRAFAAIPDLCLGFDVIAGFPGETDAEFSATTALIEQLPVAYLHVFPFSSRPGTKAAGMPGQLQSRVITERAELLRSLGEKKKRQYLRRFRGRTLQPLVLKRDSDGLWNGLTANYLPVTFAAEGDFANNIVAVRVVNADGETLVAELLQ
ncbi:tRNA (N(6)-L-threonylcarbamoyladenosine(37)-C(2))-methylthiotransferase MtaB [Geobacter pelophilus]|uniref:tRNA (N(6)-L-threonylcarbamoyladenosine(37)-C(2))-methylthiotransferase MtaB n=1 Tax=Geoanaerobacter pelophilus TaxID=60036 RepID=A0AAW4LAW9_9BACT|nr:tRNA (N(6)-L-threonylcarbamoyladenosine(37)-C(2))-methylthiotransferase MtaB [Geoanaerobacter pelophilus]MBT0665511.1 tRNA (N(6)-L-threonylcarbamoyladenosine(37)-C(2))-methylthiotransferase MtaB [Geoanaerobacter pelophilus]